MSQSVAHHVVKQGNQSVPVAVVEATEIEAHARCTQQHVHSVASKQKSHSSHEVINRYTAEIATLPKDKSQDNLVDLVIYQPDSADILLLRTKACPRLLIKNKRAILYFFVSDIPSLCYPIKASNGDLGQKYRLLL